MDKWPGFLRFTTAVSARAVVRAQRIFGVASAIVFALVGLIFLVRPGDVLTLFNSLSVRFGLPQSPVDGGGFYLVLAVAYMYLVAVLAYMMYRRPEVASYALLLAHAKSASAALSLYMFLVHGRYLICLVNMAVDGLLGAVAAFFYRKGQGKPA